MKSLSSAGFTLLEVMVSVTIIAIALVTLIGAQSQSVSIATDSRFATIASLLARQKMAEIVLTSVDDLHTDEGDFGDDFPDYHWQVEVQDLSEDDTGITNVDDLLKAVDLTITSSVGSKEKFVIRRIIMAPVQAPGSP